jgi:hypothetical protein
MEGMLKKKEGIFVEAENGGRFQNKFWDPELGI